MVSSFVKTEVNKSQELLVKLSEDYQNYKGYYPFYNTMFNSKSKLRMIRIFFDTPSFDRITKDDAAKGVNMLSAVGGTMGLLTGFSIISAVEIIFFLAKIILDIFAQKNDK